MSKLKTQMSNVKTTLKLRFYPDPVLRKKCKKVEVVTFKIKELLRGMAQVMYDSKGIGLAGPQVGQLKRVITVNVPIPNQIKDLEGIGTEKGLISLVNPRITSLKGTQIDEEGCLSFPGLFIKVKRAQEVEVEGLVLTLQQAQGHPERSRGVSGAEGEGELIKIKAQGLLARVFQHEIDHLNGILMINRLGFVEKLKIGKKLKKLESVQA